MRLNLRPIGRAARRRLARPLLLCFAAGLAAASAAAAEPLPPDLLVPRLVGEWVHVYQPTGDVFPGPDSPRFKAGQSYPDWQVNDHAILKGPDGRWHAFGITHPAVAAGEPNPHEAEWLLFHAAAPAGTLKQTLAAGAWKDQPKVLPPARRRGEIREIHSPSIIHHAGQYWMFYGYSPIRYAISQDLWTWEPRGELFRQEGGARDPSVLHHQGLFYMAYTTKLSILVRTSRDLLLWTEPVTVFSLAPGETGGPESPTLLARHGGFYLLWCRWDAKLSQAGATYQDRSLVFYSADPLNFRDRQPVAEIQGHAPELFQDEDGDWWVSSAERPFRGVSLAPVRWEPRNTPPSRKGAPAGPAAHRSADAAWLRAKGTRIFHDAFEREETGTGAKAIGHGWNSATADRVPELKQADLDQGILKITSATKEAGHAAHIHHDAGLADGGAIVRFRFPGLNKGESLQLGFVDRETNGIHAGHLCYARLDPSTITLMDWKTGVMNLEIRARRQPYLDRKEPLPADLEALLKTKQATVPWKADREWHELVLVTEGDEMRLSLDGQLVAAHHSAGFAHPTKRWFSLLVPSTVWIDDVELWRVK